MTTQLKHRADREEREMAAARSLAGTRPEALHGAHDPSSEDGPEVRTCTHCGEHLAFRIDPVGSWAECPVCGHLS